MLIAVFSLYLCCSICSILLLVILHCSFFSHPGYQLLLMSVILGGSEPDMGQPAPLRNSQNSFLKEGNKHW